MLPGERERHFMLIEDFFEAVDRAFTREADRIPSPHRLELTIPLLRSLSAPESSPATPRQSVVISQRVVPTLLQQ